MINHARTLLLNIPAGEGFGDELIDPSYKPRELPKHLKAMHKVLFGTDASRELMNYNASRYLTILHGTDLEQHVLAFDPRITYWPLSDAPWFVNKPDPRSLVEIIHEADSLAERIQYKLFGTSNQEPYATFFALWLRHPQLVYRFGGLLLAYIYQVAELEQ